jgi:hypothetical protein
VHLLASKKAYFGHHLFAKITRSTIPAEYNTRAGIIDAAIYAITRWYQGAMSEVHSSV